VAQTYTLREALSSAAAAANGGDLTRAESIARAVLDRFPRCLNAHRTIADVYYRQGRHEAAVGEYEIVAALEPFDFTAYSAMASIEMRRGHIADAEHNRDMAADHASGAFGGTGSIGSLSPARLAILNERSRLYPQAIDQIGQILPSSRDRLDLYLVLARSLFFSRLWQPAEETILAILTSAPDCLQANILAAGLAFHNGNRDVARSHLNRAFAVDPVGDAIRLMAAGYLPDDLLVYPSSTPKPAAGGEATSTAKDENEDTPEAAQPAQAARESEREMPQSEPASLESAVPVAAAASFGGSASL
jgi:tetratricopeptide (TPR) repeat protein